MKDHLEGLKCLRQSMAPKNHYRSDQFSRRATASIHLGPVTATTEEEADRDSALTPTKEVEERHRDHSRAALFKPPRKLFSTYIPHLQI